MSDLLQTALNYTQPILKPLFPEKAVYFLAHGTDFSEFFFYLGLVRNYEKGHKKLTDKLFF